jgi:hypothetical protein
MLSFARTEPMPLELSPKHVTVLERIAGHGFAIVAFPLYASAVGIRKGNCAALLNAKAGGRFDLFGEPCHLIDGNLSVRVRRDGRDMFVWKKRELTATPERLAELTVFRQELEQLLAETE